MQSEILAVLPAPWQQKHTRRDVPARHTAIRARSTQCWPWTRAGSCAAPRRAPVPYSFLSPMTMTHSPTAMPPPATSPPVPEPHTPLPQDSQTGCWPWSVTSASLSAKSQSRSALVFLEEAPTPPAQLLSKNSPQSQCQNTHSSS